MLEFFAAIAYLTRPLAAAAGFGGVAWWLGSKARRALRIEVSSEERIGRAGVDLALGLALLAALGFWLGIAGWLTLWGLVGGVGAMAGVLWALCRWLEEPDRRGARSCARRDGDNGGEAFSASRAHGRAPLPTTVRAVLGLIVLLPLVALALYPPTGFDALMYHLPFAKAFVATGGLPFLADLRYPVFTQANEVLFAEAMMLGGDRAAQLMSLLATLATATILFGWARRDSRKGKVSGAVGELAMALFLGGPIVAYLSGLAYCEPLLVLFVAAAFDQFDRLDEGAGDLSRWGLAGVFAGSAAGVKYFGLFPVGVLLALALWARAENRAVRWRRLACALGGVVLLATPWYVRNVFYTGNPVFPVLERLFGPSVWGGPSELAPWSGSQGGLSQIARMIRLPWTLTFGRPAFGRMPPWSPVIGIALAAACLAVRRERRVRWLLGTSLLYLTAFLFLPLDARFLLPILPLLCVAGALALATLLEKRRYLLRAAVVLALAPTALWSFYQLHRQGPLPLSIEAREQFLGDRLPAYRALRFLERTRGASASVYAFYAENHVYYAPGRFQGDWGGRTPYSEIVKLCRSGDLLAEGLRARGVTHLLTVVVGEPPLPRDESFARRFQLVYDDGKARVWEIR